MNYDNISLVELRNYSAGFDRVEEKSPLWFGDNKEFKVQGWKGIYNIDRKKMATVSSDRYMSVQHKDFVVAVVESLLNLNIKTTARVRDGGNRIFVDLTFTDHRMPLKKGEEFLAGVRMINSYDRTTGIIVAPRYLRCVCNNGMVVNQIIRGFAVKHTKKLTQDFEVTIQRLLKRMINEQEGFRKLVNDCIGDSIEWELMEKVLKSLAGSKKHIEKIKLLLPENPTRWDLYNAFTEYATHDAQLRPNVEQMLQTKAQKLLVTPLRVLVPQEQHTA